jgi:hypothetical protein
MNSGSLGRTNSTRSNPKLPQHELARVGVVDDLVASKLRTARSKEDAAGLNPQRTPGGKLSRRVMKIYYFGTQDNHAYLYAPGGGGDRYAPDPPRSLAAEWVPPIFELVSRDEFRSYLPKSDFPAYLPSTIMLSNRPVERLRNLVSTCGEVLPIHLSNDRDLVYLFNVTRVINAVDMSRSEFLRFPSGGIMKYERLVFDHKMIPDEAVFFKTPQLGPISEIFANDLAVAAVKRAGLTGYEFRLAWTNE